MSFKKYIKAFLPGPVVRMLAFLKSGVDYFIKIILWGCFSRNAFFAKLYYSLFSNEFSREHKAVLAGKFKYHSSLTSPVTSSYLLRRNIHRLEKGLIMPSRRPVFAKEYIAETVREYIRVLENVGCENISENVELLWSRDVLNQYFQCVDFKSDGLLRTLRSSFIDANKPRVNSQGLIGEPMIPFRRVGSSKAVNFDELYALSKHRRSVRFFQSDRPCRDAVDNAMRVALQAPSACNRQPFSFRLFDDKDKVLEVSSIPAGTKTFYRELPAVAVVVGHLEAYYRERDRHAMYIDASLAVMSFVYGLECQGISTCIINWGDEEPAESKMSSLLNLEGSDRVLMLVGYGYPAYDVEVPYSAKRNLEDVRSYNEY